MRPGGLGAPDCTTAPMKLWEGPWFTESYNECGFRTAEPCFRRPPGLRRVAVLGTSQAHGMDVPYEDTFAARATAELKAACGGPVDFQNLSLPGATVAGAPVWDQILTRMPQALALRPTAVITILSSTDLSYYEAPPWQATSALGGQGAQRERGAGPLDRLKRLSYSIAVESIAVQAMRSVMFRNGDVYLSRFLDTGRGDYLLGDMDAKWRMRLGIADSVLGRMADQARAAGVPFIAFFYPSYPQAIAAQGTYRSRTLTPYKVQDALRAIVEAHGGKIVDITPALASLPDLASYYYVSNDHPNSRGHEIMAANVVAGLIAAVPAFANCKASPR